MQTVVASGPTQALFHPTALFLHAFKNRTLYIKNDFQLSFVWVWEYFIFTTLWICHPVCSSLLYYSACLNIDSDLRLSPSISIPSLVTIPPTHLLFLHLTSLTHFYTHPCEHAQTHTHLHMPTDALTLLHTQGHTAVFYKWNLRRRNCGFPGNSILVRWHNAGSWEANSVLKMH